MRALVCLGNKKLEVRDLPKPVIERPDHVIVKMKASGICGSDLNQFRVPAEKMKGQFYVPGHEPAGIIEEIGEAVTVVKPGDRVSIHHYEGCGKCEFCRQGYYMRCPTTKAMGMIGCQGSFADYKLTREANCVRLPEELSFAAGALISCGAQTTYNALRSIDISGRDDLVIFGLGSLGLCGVAIGKAMGAKVAAVGRRKDRLRIAAEYGADSVLDVDKYRGLDGITTEDIMKKEEQREKFKTLVLAKAKELKKVFPGGFSAAYETSGNPTVQHEMFFLLRYEGRVATIAWDASIPTGLMVGKAITVKGSFVMPRGMCGELIHFLVERRVDLDRMVTHRFSIEESPQAFSLADSKECGKVIVEWN